MTVKEFMLKLPLSSRSFLSLINQYVLDGIWLAPGTGIVAADLTNMATTIILYNASKELNPIIIDFMEYSNINLDTISDSQVQTIVKFLYTTYRDKWAKLWTYVYRQEYTPIWNVDGEESIVHTFEHGKKVTETKNLTITMNKGSTETEIVTNNITDNDICAFNSSTPVGASKSTNNGSKTNVGSGNDSDAHTGTDTFQDSGVDTESTTQTRGGNIGVTSTQSLLEQEIELRKKFNYFEIVIKDIIRELAINIYE